MDNPQVPTFGADEDGTFPIAATIRVKITDANELLAYTLADGNNSAAVTTMLTHAVAKALSGSALFWPKGLSVEGVRVELDGKVVETTVEGFNE